MMIRLIGVVVIGCLSIAAASAQEYRKATRVSLNLRDVVKVVPAKNGDEPSVVVRVSKAKADRIVPVTRVRTEERTRVVQVDGKQVEQSYTVKVPFTMNVRQKIAPTQTLPIAKLSAWDLRGNPIEQAELIQRLSKPVAAFFVDKSFPKDGEVDPAQLSVLREDILILHAAKPDNKAPALPGAPALIPRRR